MTPWQRLLSNSLIASGTAWDHLMAQRAGSPVQLVQSNTGIQSMRVNEVKVTPISRTLISERVATPLVLAKSTLLKISRP